VLAAHLVAGRVARATGVRVVAAVSAAAAWMAAVRTIIATI